MSDLKRSADFRIGTRRVPATSATPGIEESQPWHAAEVQKNLDLWAQTAEAGCDPYNNTGIRAIRRTG